MTESIAKRLAEFTEACKIDTLSAATRRRASLHVLDTLGVIVAGASEASSRVVVDAVVALGGTGRCTVIGYPLRASVRDAALVNGALAHALEMDDDHRTSALHPGAVVVPAALAAAEFVDAGGDAFLEGVVAGYEVMVRLGEVFRGSQDRRGFHSTGTCGVFGAAAAAGRIFDLSADELIWGFGIAASRASGIQAWKSDGSWTKRLHPGMAAEGGLFSALLAAHGFNGPETVFEGSNGFLKAYTGGGQVSLSTITDGLGDEFRGSTTAFKPYACCRFAHPLVDAILRAVREYDLQPDDLERCHIRLYRSGYEALFEPAQRRRRPRTSVDAQFSAPFIAAVSLLHGPPLPCHFTEPMVSDPELLKIADRIFGKPDSAYEEQFPDRYPTSVTFHLMDGREIEAFEEIADGDPAKCIYQEDPERFEREIVTKFRMLFKGLPPSQERQDAAERILAAVFDLEHLTKIDELSRILSAPGDGGT